MNWKHLAGKLRSRKSDANQTGGYWKPSQVHHSGRVQAVSHVEELQVEVFRNVLVSAIQVPSIHSASNSSRCYYPVLLFISANQMGLRCQDGRMLDDKCPKSPKKVVSKAPFECRGSHSPQSVYSFYRRPAPKDTLLTRGDGFLLEVCTKGCSLARGDGYQSCTHGSTCFQDG